MMIKKLLLVALPLAITACGSSSSTSEQSSPGNTLREKINKESAAYGECVIGAIKSIELKDRLAPILADEAFKSCRGSRDALYADVLAFRRMGHPSEPVANSKVSADQSVINLDADLRERVLVIATQRKLAEETGNNAAD